VTNETPVQQSVAVRAKVESMFTLSALVRMNGPYQDAYRCEMRQVASNAKDIHVDVWDISIQLVSSKEAQALMMFSQSITAMDLLTTLKPTWSRQQNVRLSCSFR